MKTHYLNNYLGIHYTYHNTVVIGIGNSWYSIRLNIMHKIINWFLLIYTELVLMLIKILFHSHFHAKQTNKYKYIPQWDSENTKLKFPIANIYFIHVF